MMYFLSVVLIGTVYPIFIEVNADEKISICPPFFNKLIIPFLIPFLLVMTIGPNLKWIKYQSKKVDKKKLILLFTALVFAYYLFQLFDNYNYYKSKNSFFLIFHILLMKQTNYQKLSHNLYK